MICTAQKLIEVARSYIGYEEKASNSKLEDFHANRGRANFTKFQPPLDGGANGDQWCQYFAYYCAYEACGYNLNDAEFLCYAPKRSWMTGYTPDASDCFKRAGAWYEEPEPGDFVYFYITGKGRIGHVGIVAWVDKAAKTFNTVEGNTSSDKYDDNGGCVAVHTYSYAKVGGTNRVAGFGRPRYEKEDDEMTEEHAKKFIEAAYQAVLGRDPEPVGLENWVSALTGGMKDYEVLDELRRSKEHYGLRAEIIKLIYAKYLNREPDEAEIKAWADTDLNVDRLIEKIKGSAEYAELHQYGD